MKINLKVFINKKNGQSAIHLPKKMFETLPSSVEIKVPRKLIKKEFRRKIW